MKWMVCGMQISNCDLLKWSSQGAIFTLDMSEDGYSTGGKDGTVKLWDPDFKPVTSVNLSNSPVGYKGRQQAIDELPSDSYN